MKARTRTSKNKNNTVDETNLSVYTSRYQEPYEINDTVVQFFPIIVGFLLLLMFSWVTFLSFVGDLYSVGFIFLFLSLAIFSFIISKLQIFKNPYTFHWDSKKYDSKNIKNSYNYYQTPQLTKLTKSKFWKFIYLSEFYNRIIFSLVGLPILWLFILAWIIINTWKDPSPTILLLIMLWPTILYSLKLFINLVKTKSQIYSKKNNFYYISRNSKTLWFSMENNSEWWVDYYFQK